MPNPGIKGFSLLSGLKKLVSIENRQVKVRGCLDLQIDIFDSKEFYSFRENKIYLRFPKKDIFRNIIFRLLSSTI